LVGRRYGSRVQWCVLLWAFGRSCRGRSLVADLCFIYGQSGVCDTAVIVRVKIGVHGILIFQACSEVAVEADVVCAQAFRAQSAPNIQSKGRFTEDR
jgi:hypothetical protein